ncbi:MAG: hypothetical protein RID22_14875 [Roseibium aggregatum]|uniref:hypothetical protein n=1 Tax=uncultured Roseibium sp. TaxID=1936171 RepID=UPI0026284716|nr:hypothetical protein [uncultured Roseibium sp.]
MKTVVDTLGVTLTAVHEWVKGNAKPSHNYQKNTGRNAVSAHQDLDAERLISGYIRVFADLNRVL